MLRLSAGAATLAVSLCFMTLANADECGELKVPGYTAKRTIGSTELRAAVTRERERTEDAGSGEIRIMEFGTMAAIILNPKAKVAIKVSPPPKPPEKPGQREQMEKNKFVDRVPGKDGLVTVSMGMKTPNGKEWIIQAVCRPDGIWVERKVKTPKGLVTMTQSDIKTDAIPAAEFDVPSDYKLVDAPKQPPAKN